MTNDFPLNPHDALTTSISGLTSQVKPCGSAKRKRGTTCKSNNPDDKNDTSRPMRARKTAHSATANNSISVGLSKDADVGVFTTGWPNKQQSDQMYRQKLAWEKNRREGSSLEIGLRWR
ncbi:hypothetical protein E5D57_007587 [Metarhizium anisopliae]|nr:hypothetical protein E5D57_007587 [Metarhizium anisopliae]